MSTRVILRAAAILLPFVACRADLAVPGEARVACASDEQCPPGFACNPAVGLCANLGRSDKTPPFVLPDSVAIDPSVAGEAALLSARFTVSEPLAAAPKVTLCGRPMAFASEEGESYLYTTHVVGDEPEGAPQIIGAELTDRPGNTTVIDVGLVRFDFTPPVIAGLTVVGSARIGALKDAIVDVALGDLDEIVERVELADSGAPFETAEGAIPPTYRYSYTPELADEGARSVRVVARDAAGNRSEKLAPALLLFDFTDPALDGAVTVELQPAADNPLREAGAAKSGTRARVTFTVTEELDEPAELVGHVWGSTETLAFLRTGGVGTTHVFEALVTDEPAGDYELTGSGVDLAGNEGSWPAGTVNVDTEAPPPPEVDTGSSTCLVRQPWGTADSAAPAAWIALDASDLVETAAVIAYSASASPRVELGRNDAPVSGPLRVNLALASLADVYLEAVDQAGNASASVLVRCGEWLASLRQKELGSESANPNTYSTHGRLDHSLDQGRGAEQDATLVGAPDDVLARASSAGVGWFRPSAAAPTGRARGSVAYDPRRGRVVVFGGTTTTDIYGNHFGPDCNEGDADYCGFTWEWDGERWFLASASPPPRARAGAGMAYDPLAGLTLLFGGRSNSDCGEGSALYCSYTWGWDGERWRVLATEGPTGRADLAMAFEPSLGQIVLHGGRLFNGDCGEGSGSSCATTWGWDGQAWSPLSLPEAGFDNERHAIAYDEAGARLVMFGGNAGSGDRVAVFDGSAWNASTEPSGLDPVWRPGLVFDAVENAILLFGGERVGFLADTYALEGTAFVARPYASPPPRQGAAMVFERGHSQTFLFGGAVDYDGDCGEGLGDICNRVWILRNGEWRSRRRVVGDVPRGRHIAAAYDPSLTGVLAVPDDDVDSLSTWLLGSTGWQQLPPSTPPTFRQGHAMAFAHTPGKVVLFGGSYLYYPPMPPPVTAYRRDTYTFDGTTWTSRGNGTPAGRAGHQIVDAGTHGLVMHGGKSTTCDVGAYCRNLWSYDDTSGDWTLLSSSITLPARAYHAMAYDSVHDDLVIFGGQDDGTPSHHTDTWRYDFSTDTAVEIAKAGGPTGSFNSGMVWDASAERLLLYEGAPAFLQPAYGRTWILEADSWVLDDANDPPARFGAGLIFDEESNQVVLVGGAQVSPGTTDISLATDTWLRETVLGESPGHLVRFDLEDVPAASFDALYVSWICGATAQTDGDPVDGVAVDLWIGDRWQQIATGPGSESEPAMLETEVTNPTWLARILWGPRHELGLRLRSAETGKRAAVVADYVDVRVTYHR